MSAVEAAVAVARAHGLRCDDPVVLREAWHVLVHLRPSPVVARVTSGRPGSNDDDVVRELGVARHAAAKGAPVVQPSDLVDPGPHEHGGHTMVFWRFVDATSEVDPHAAGEGLRAIHEALADYAGELPPANRAADVAAMLATLPPSDDVELLREVSSRELPAGQALHGDAHIHNCMPGPVWHDFETAVRGPREYDLAALLMRDRLGGPQPEARAALVAYGDHDEALLDEALPVYAAWITASYLVALPRRPSLASFVDPQLAFLRRHRR